MCAFQVCYMLCNDPVWGNIWSLLRFVFWRYENHDLKKERAAVCVAVSGRSLSFLNFISLFSRLYKHMNQNWKRFGPSNHNNRIALNFDACNLFCFFYYFRFSQIAPLKWNFDFFKVSFEKKKKFVSSSYVKLRFWQKEKMIKHYPSYVHQIAPFLLVEFCFSCASDVAVASLTQCVCVCVCMFNTNYSCIMWWPLKRGT